MTPVNALNRSLIRYAGSERQSSFRGWQCCFLELRALVRAISLRQRERDRADGQK